MRLTRAEATFGKLEQARLTFGPGLNIITGPNESGKSSWVSFLLAMLYGIDTGARKRGDQLPDKTLYAPWSGRRMEGELLLEASQGPVLVRRTTQRAGAPLQHCVILDPRTGEPWPDLRGDTLGETLTGAGREAYVRSAYIGREGLAVSGSRALEQKLSALLSGGDREDSAAEALDRLNQWRNGLDRTRTGRLQQTQEQLEQVREQQRRRKELEDRQAALEQELSALAQQEADARRQAQQEWQRQEAELTRLLEQAENRRRETAAALAELEQDGPLPEREALLKLLALEQAAQAAQTLAEQGAQSRERAERERDAAAAEPLLAAYPGETDQSLWQQAQQDAAAAARRVPGRWIPLAAVGMGALLLALTPLLTVLALPGALLLAAAGGLGLYRRKQAQVLAQRLRQRWQTERPEEILARAADFRAAWERRQAREDRLQEEDTALEALWKRRDDAQNEAAALRTALGLTDAAPVEALQRRRSRWETLCQQQTALEGEIALLRQRLQAGTAAAGQPADREMAETGPLAALSRQRETLARAKAETVGALSQFPPAQVLAERLRQLERQEERIRWNCRAIQLAEAAVSEAQRQLRLNFAPELNDRAGRYLAAFTAGRYQEMLVSREFIPQARGAGMLEARGTPELSRGTGDQMYLALRLALCDMTLPQKPTLVLDDALVAFDEQRLAAVLEVLREKGRQQQILLFTCQQRESQMLAQAPEVTQIRLEAKE